MLPSSAWQRRHEVFHPYTFILLLTNLSLGMSPSYLGDGRPSSLGQMQLATPMLVPMAVRIVMSVWITSFQMSRFSIVPITIYHLQCTIQLFSSPPSQGGSGRVSFPFWPVTMQRYNSVPRDVKRHPRFGGDLTLSHDGQWQWLWLYNQRHKRPSAIAIHHSQKNAY